MTEARVRELLDALAETAPEPDDDQLMSAVHASAGLRRRLRARRPARSLLPVLVAAATVVAVLLAVGLVSLSRTSHPAPPATSPTVADDAPLAAGRTFAEIFFSPDYRTIGSYSDRVSAASTGGFRHDFDAKRAQLAQLTRQARSIARGRVLAAAVREVRPTSATVLLVVDQDVRSKATRAPVIQRYRVAETMRLVDGRWLVEALEPVIGAEPGACADPTESAERNGLLRETCAAVGRLYSYDYRHLDADIAAQLALTTGPLRQQIERTTAPALRQLAPKVQGRVVAAARPAAIERFDGDTATVLVFLDQTVRSDQLQQPRYDRIRLEVTMQRVDGRWLVSGIQAL